MMFLAFSCKRSLVYIFLNLIRQMINEFSETRPKLAELLYQIVDEIAKNPESYIGKDISIIINQMRYEAINKEIDAFAKKWFIDPEAVKYEIFNYNVIIRFHIHSYNYSK